MAQQRKSEKPYDAAMNKYSEGVPAIGKIATEIALQLQIANTSNPAIYTPIRDSKNIL